MSEDISRALDAARTRTARTVDQFVELQDLRLERLLCAVWDCAIAGQVGAAGTALKILARQAKLRGLDAKPASLDLSPFPDEEIVNLVDELVQLAANALVDE